jgi:predicted TIM-barrel fold metal-dependent hydrolase
MDIIRLIGADRVVFGSDYPHPEGLAEPTSYVDRLSGLSQEDIAKVMGGNMAEILRLAAA